MVLKLPVLVLALPTQLLGLYVLFNVSHIISGSIMGSSVAVNFRHNRFNHPAVCLAHTGCLKINRLLSKDKTGSIFHDQGLIFLSCAFYE